MRDYVKRKGCQRALDVSTPTFPQLMKAFRHHPAPGPEGYTNARTVAAAPEYAFVDSAGNNQVVDLVVVGSAYPKGTIHTMDMSDPYNPAVMGVVRNSAGTVVDNIFATDIAVSKAAGLIYVTAGMSVYVIDAKDPYHPVILNIITQAPNADGTMMSLGYSPAVAEKDGWVYLANQQKGLRVLDLDPVYLSQYCNDSEFPVGAWKFCSDYYPALGWKTIVLEGRDTYWHLLDAPVKVKLKTMPGNGIEVRPEGGAICTSADTCKATFDKGYVRFQIKAPANISDNFIVEFQIDPASLPEHEQTLLATFANLQQYSMRTVRLWKRDNSNITLGEVLKGEAAFVFDATTDTTRHGAYRQNEQEHDKRLYYVQEMLNQVVVRKRNLENPFSQSSYNPYVLIEEGGRYGPETYNQLAAFKYNFDLNVNDVVGPYPYSTNPAEDNTSSIFRKLMKDYNKRRTGNPWLIDGAAGDSWLYKVVDKETLVGKDSRIPAETVAVTTDNADVLLNTDSNNTREDSGLYELYKNAVERFNRNLINLAESYERKANPDNALVGEPGQWVPREGSAQVKTNNSTPLAVAYSYGGRQTVLLFNDTVSRHGAPRTADFANNATYRSYRGRIGDVESNLINQFPHGNVGGGNRKWPGLIMDEEYFDWYNNTNRSDNHHFYHEYWAGIDCIGLTLHGLRYAEDPRRDHDNDGRNYAVEQMLTGADDSAIPGVRVGNACISGDCQNPQSRVSVHTYRGMMDTNVERFFDAGNADLLYYWQRTVANTKLIRKGDVVRYGRAHISTVYSERPQDCGDTGASCTYEIIHAYGGDSYKKIINGDEQRVFSRKVCITPNDISTTINNPTGFGRIKLWD